MTHRNLIGWNAVAKRVISGIRKPVSIGHQLMQPRGRKRTKEGDKKADVHNKISKRSRTQYEQLSCYYPLPKNRKVWVTGDLLLEGMHEVITRCCDGPLT
jgi:hypothetical protein